MKQTLHIGDKVKVINCKRMTFHTGEITDFILGQNNNVKVKINNYSGYFYFNESELQLIKPKTKKVKKLKFTKEERDSMLEWWNKFNGEERTLKLIELYKSATQPQPIKEEECPACNNPLSKYIHTCKNHNKLNKELKQSTPSPQEESKDIEKIAEEQFRGFYQTDSKNIYDLWQKQCEVIDTLNSLTKRNIK